MWVYRGVGTYEFIVSELNDNMVEGSSSEFASFKLRFQMRVDIVPNIIIRPIIISSSMNVSDQIDDLDISREIDG